MGIINEDPGKSEIYQYYGFSHTVGRLRRGEHGTESRGGMGDQSGGTRGCPYGASAGVSMILRAGGGGGAVLLSSSVQRMGGWAGPPVGPPPPLHRADPTPTLPVS